MTQQTNIKFEENISTSVSDFPGMVRNFTLVDKTYAIRDFILDGSPMHLILRPRRSGKSLFLSMMRTYLEMPATGEKLDERKSLFVKTPLMVAKEPFFEEHLGKYPIININLSPLQGTTWAEMLEAFSMQVRGEFVRHKARGDFADVMDEDHRKFIKTVIDDTANLSEGFLHDSLMTLSHILFGALQQPVVVLVDEYDKPTTAASIEVEKGYGSRAMAFFKMTFHKLLKENPAVSGALLTGVLHLAQTGFLSGLNTLTIYGSNNSNYITHSVKYSTAMYLTKSEVCQMFAHYKAKHGDELSFTLKDIAHWYGGIHCGGVSSLFNLYGVLCAFKLLILDRHWKESASDAPLMRRIDASSNRLKEKVAMLINWKEVDFDQGSVTYRSTKDLNDNELLSVLNYAGYLTIPSDNTLRIPNYEVHSFFSQWVRNLAKDRMRAFSREQNTMAISMFRNAVDGSFEDFQYQFRTMILKYLSAWLFGKSEHVHHAFVFGVFLAVAKESEYHVSIEEEGGNGRMDLLVSQRRGNCAIIIEFKISKEKKAMDTDARRALEQIDVKKYRAKLCEEITNLREYGIAFYNKECAIRGRGLTRRVRGKRGWRTVNLS